MPPLPQALAEMAPPLAKLVAPVVEQVAQRLTKGHRTSAKPLSVPTLLTQANRSAGRDRVRTAPSRVAKTPRVETPAGCRECEVVLEDLVPAEPLARQMSYAAKWPAEHWTLAFQGNVHNIPGEDYRLIRAEIEKAAEAQ
jgi:hypothetical protein